MKFISDGMTDSLQPLDRTVFGTMKAAARRMFRMQTAKFQCPWLMMQMADQFLTRDWEQVNTQVLDRAWQIYELDDEPS
jgi:acyl carrier protein phosphodiesterase